MEGLYGIPARFCQGLRLEQDGSSRAFRGLLQPLRSRDQASRQRRVGELGTYAQGLFAFYGPGSLPAAQGDVIAWQEKRYVLRRLERFYLGNRALYCWGLCTEEGEALWTQSSQES